MTLVAQSLLGSVLRGGGLGLAPLSPLCLTGSVLAALTVSADNRKLRRDSPMGAFTYPRAIGGSAVR